MIRNVLYKQIAVKFRKYIIDNKHEKAKSLYDKHKGKMSSLREIWTQQYAKCLKEKNSEVALQLACIFENTRRWVVPAATSLVQSALCTGDYKKAREILRQYPVHYFSIIEIIGTLRKEKKSDLRMILEAFEPKPRRNQEEVLDIMNATLAILQDSNYRQGFVFELPKESELIISGDLHGNRTNFEIIKKKAKLEKFPNRHVIFQEIIHSRGLLVDNRDVSFLEVIDCLEFLVSFPGQVHILMGNHDLNFLLNRSSMRSNKNLDDNFFRGLEVILGAKQERIIEKYKEIIRWMAVAIKCGPIIATHSNPSGKNMKKFDFERLKKIFPLKGGEEIDFLVSDRDHGDLVLQEFLKKCDSSFSVIGHEFCRDGFCFSNSQQVIIDSCHNFGTYLHCFPDKIKSIEQLQNSIFSLRKGTRKFSKENGKK